MKEFQPCEASYDPDGDIKKGCNQAQAPPGLLTDVDRAEIDWRGSGAVMSERSSQIREVCERCGSQQRRYPGGERHDQERSIHRRDVRCNARESVVRIE